MKIWIDTNVLLDVLCNCPNFVEASVKVWKLCEVKKLEGYISALSVTNIVYILRKELTPQKTQEIISKIMLIFHTADLRTSDLQCAAEQYMSDFEDAVQIVSAERIKADFIVTRNIRDFRESKIPVFNPDELLARI